MHSSSSSSTNRLTTTTTTSYDDSVQCGDDSVFLPNSPASKLSQLSLCPGRPPKPPSLRNLPSSYPGLGSSGASDNYENQQDVLGAKVETNNNCDSNCETPGPLPPCINRTCSVPKWKPTTTVIATARLQAPCRR